MTASEHIGQRVRMYREQKKMTLSRFASLLHKAASTVSKYESGAIVIDVNTLYEIAAILEVSVGQLSDYRDERYFPPKQLVTGNFFQRRDLYYLYVLFQSKTPHVCAMELTREEDDDSRGRFTLYYDIEDYDKYTKSAYLYQGDFRCFDHGTVFYLENPYNAGDVGMIYAKSPFTTDNTTTGLFAFVPSKLRNPCATKVIFSTSPVQIDKQLLSKLNAAEKDMLSALRKMNLFVVE